LIEMKSVDESPARIGRVCMPTTRSFARKVFQCSLYEAQDVLVETEAVHLIGLEPSGGFAFRDRWQRRLIYRDLSDRLVLSNPGLKPVRLTQDYDLFVGVCQTYEDLIYLNAIQNWKERCRTSVCWIDEIWVSSIAKYKHWLAALRRFDHVFVGYHGTVQPLSEALGRPCQWVPGAVDALRFTPGLDGPPRVIDVFSMGRRWQGVHESLLRMARHREIYYVHDTYSGAGATAFDHREHRDVLAAHAQRSRYFMVAPAKMDAPEETRGQVEIGYRYYEGAAAGAIMIGREPNTPVFRQMFNWPDAVVEIETDGSDVASVIRRSDANPDRLAAIGRRNAAQALRQHDWIHRWHAIYESAGVAAAPGMTARRDRLHTLANAIDSVSDSPLRTAAAL